MTREEEIIQESRIEFPSNELHEYQVGFELGAKWADEHPKDNLVDIDKVCEAFCKCECCGCCGEHKFNCTILGDFKQAMKGE